MKRKYLREILNLQDEIDEFFIKAMLSKDLDEFEYYRQLIMVSIDAIREMQKE